MWGLERYIFWCLRVGSGCGSLGKVNLVVSKVLCSVFGVW